MASRRAGGAPTRTLTHFRAWPRRRVAMSAGVVDLDRGASFAGRTVDMGIGGIRIDFPSPDPAMLPETAVELVLTAPMRWDPVRVRGKVAWRDGNGVYGFRFEHVSPAGLLALWEVLEASI